MTDKKKAKLVIVLVPVIIFGLIHLGNTHFKYNIKPSFVLSFTVDKTEYERGWDFYVKIMGERIEKPDNLTNIGMTTCSPIGVPRNYPFVTSSYYEQNYVKHTFYMPWGDFQSYWIMEEINNG